MRKKKNKAGFIIKLVATLMVIVTIFTGGYFFLDKKIVPKYFGSYGIDSISDLVGVVSSLYNSPKESSMITNGHTQTDFDNAVSKLQKAGYKLDDNGAMKEQDFANFKGEGLVKLTDKELAAICNKFLQDGILVDALPELNYLNVINISILEAVVTPDKESKEGEYYTKANLSAIFKIDTKDICEQIAKQMGTPLFLLNMIIPDVLYFSVSYDIDLKAETQNENSESELNQEETKKDVSASGSISINGRSEKQSKILIDLLVDFIFPEEDEMNIDKFSEELSKVIVEGIEVLGDFKFAGGFGSGEKQNGVVVNPNAIVVPTPPATEEGGEEGGLEEPVVPPLEESEEETPVPPEEEGEEEV